MAIQEHEDASSSRRQSSTSDPSSSAGRGEIAAGQQSGLRDDDLVSRLSPTEYSQLSRSVLWKTDLQVTLLAALLFLWSFLDRSNIGQAKLLGLATQLNLSPHDYSVALTVLYVPYIVFELPSNLLLKRVGPARLIPALVTAWGIVATLQGIVKTRTGLYINRFFLGLAEAGILPGIVVYFSFFYRPEEIQLRQALNFSGASLAGSLGALLSAAISPLHAGGLQPWSWLFIIEGIATVLFGLASFWLLPNGPEKLKGVTELERQVAVHRVKGGQATFAAVKGGQEEQGETATVVGDGASPSSEKESGKPQGNADLARHLSTFNRGDVLRTFVDPFVWLLGCVHFCSAVGVYSVAFFAPTIVKSLNLKNGQLTLAESLLLVTPPYALAFLVSIALALAADRYRLRGPSTAVSFLLATIGFAMAYGSNGSAGVAYAGLMLIAAGAYSGPSATLSWVSVGTASHYKRATSAALMIVLTNSGGIASTWLWNGTLRRGYLVCLIIHIAGVVFTVLTDLYVFYDRRARKVEGSRSKVKLEEARQRYSGASEEQLRELLGDQHPDFVLEL
ncbi:MFS general substrate transporter [Jaminaea rosea]|uniref:MFS general substrate transporter n=1 Tax=Jaminaea rosea TaxID=1569628 RepID=A0A316UP96_9BASI|nr:MFS general substrate transporter [Jaminaea rosea]PWN27100.1 MFS general substrate transporter [Jaminaea rosea]